MATYVQNVRFTGGSGGGFVVANTLQMWPGTDSYSAARLWQDNQGDYYDLDFELVDDSSGNDANIEPNSYSNGHTIEIRSGWTGQVLWYTTETWTTNGSKWEALDDGDATFPAAVYPRSYPSGGTTPSWRTYDTFEFRSIVEPLIVRFYYKSGGSWSVPAYEEVQIDAPWAWSYPRCDGIRIGGSPTTSFYKNGTFTRGSASVELHIFQPRNTGVSQWVDFSSYWDYMNIDSPDLSSTGSKTVNVSTNFRCGSGVSTSYNITVYGIYSYNIPDLSQNSIEYPVPTGTTIYDFIPAQATINYENSQTQSINIENSWVSGDTSLASYGVKNITITIPADRILTKEPVSRTYQFDVYISKDIPNSVAWTSTYNNVTKEIAAVKTTGASKYFWVKPCQTTISGAENYSSLRLTNSPYYSESARDLSDGTTTLHYQDVVQGTLKSAETWIEHTPDISSGVANPSVISHGMTQVYLKNNNNFQVKVYSSCTYTGVTIPALSSGYLTGLTADTRYKIEFGRDYSWTQYKKTYSGDTNIIIPASTTHFITGSNTTIVQDNGNGTQLSEDSYFWTDPKKKITRDDVDLSSRTRSIGTGTTRVFINEHYDSDHEDPHRFVVRLAGAQTGTYRVDYDDTLVFNIERSWYGNRYLSVYVTPDDSWGEFPTSTWLESDRMLYITIPQRTQS